MIALGIGVAGACCAVSGDRERRRGTCRLGVDGWLVRRGDVRLPRQSTRRLGKHAGRLSPRAFLILPYLVAFRIACELIRWWRGQDAPTLVAPGFWVGGRLEARTLPAGMTHVVDLVAEYPAAAWVRTLPGYRNLPDPRRGRAAEPPGVPRSRSASCGT